MHIAAGQRSRPQILFWSNMVLKLTATRVILKLMFALMVLWPFILWILLHITTLQHKGLKFKILVNLIELRNCFNCPKISKQIFHRMKQSLKSFNEHTIFTQISIPGDLWTTITLICDPATEMEAHNFVWCLCMLSHYNLPLLEIRSLVQTSSRMTMHLCKNARFKKWLAKVDVEELKWPVQMSDLNPTPHLTSLFQVVRFQVITWN